MFILTAYLCGPISSPTNYGQHVFPKNENTSKLDLNHSSDTFTILLQISSTFSFILMITEENKSLSLKSLQAESRSTTVL